MSHSITVDHAAAKLPEIIGSLGPNEEVLLTEAGLPVARLIGHQVERHARKPGNCRGLLTIISDDEEHLNDFKDFMP